MEKIELIKKIQNATLDMMKQVKFQDENGEHLYINNKTGEWLQGVSEVSSIVPKEWLASWGAKECVKFLGFDNIERAKEIKQKISEIAIEEYLELLKEAKGSSSRKSKEALIDGKLGHEWIKSYLLAKIRQKQLPEIPKDNLSRALTQFVEWEKSEIDTWILSEARIAYPEKKYAGTLDGLAITKEGKLVLIDFKFASHISEDFYLQTAGYGMAFEPYDIRIDERIIVRLPKTLYLDIWDKRTKQYNKVENNIEIKVVDTDYQEDKEVFLHCLPLKKWINKINNK